MQIPSSASAPTRTVAADWQTEPCYEEHSGSGRRRGFRTAAGLPDGGTVTSQHVSDGEL